MGRDAAGSYDLSVGSDDTVFMSVNRSGTPSSLGLPGQIRAYSRDGLLLAAWGE